MKQYFDAVAVVVVVLAALWIYPTRSLAECAHYEESAFLRCSQENPWRLRYAVTEGRMTVATGWHTNTPMVIIEHANDATPTVVAEFSVAPYSRGLTNHGRIAVVRSYEGALASVDWSDPGNPVIQPISTAPTVALGYSQLSGWLAVSGGDEGVWLYSSQPDQHPVHVGVVTTVEPVVDAAVLQSRLYTAEGGWIRVYDISDPLSPTHVDSWRAPEIDGLETTVTDLESDGDWIAALVSANDLKSSTMVLEPGESLVLVDDVTPGAPVIRMIDGKLCTRFGGSSPDIGVGVYRVETSGLQEIFYTRVQAADIAIGDGFLVAIPISAYGDLTIYDTRYDSRVAPIVKWEVAQELGAEVTSFTGEVLVAQKYVPYEGNETWVWDIRDLESPDLIHYWPAGSWGLVHIRDHGPGWAQLSLRHTDNPGETWLFADLTIASPGIVSQQGYTTRCSDRAFGCSWGHVTISCYDISDPEQAVLLSSVDARLHDLKAISRFHALGESEDGELICVDFSNLEAPVLHPTGIDIDDYWLWEARHDDLLFMRHSGSRIDMIDVSDPTNVRRAWRWDAADGDYLDAEGPYVALGTTSAIRVFDVTDPYAPILVSECPVEEDLPYSGVWNEGVLYVASGGIYDFRDLDAPAYLGHCLNFSRGSYYNVELFHRGEHIVGAYGAYPLQCESVIGVWDDNSDPGAVPAAMAAMSVFPNPFNPVTTIEIDLARASHIELAAYDLRGRRVAVLDRGYSEAGRRLVSWSAQDESGQDLPSGAYLLRLSVGHDVTTRKVSLVR